MVLVEQPILLSSQLLSAQASIRPYGANNADRSVGKPAQDLENGLCALENAIRVALSRSERPSAIDRDRCTSDERTKVGAHPEHGVGDLLRLAQSAKRRKVDRQSVDLQRDALIATGA